jgi:hypothetical protein
VNLGEAFITLGVKPENLDMVLKFQSDLNKLNPSLKGAGEGVHKANGMLKGLHGALSSLIGPMATFKLEAFAIGSAIVGLVEKTSKVAWELTKFHNLTGMSAYSLESLQQQAAAAGISTDEMANSLENLSRIQAEARLGQANFGAWQFLGIDPRSGTPIQLLDQLQEKLKGFKSTAMGTKLAQDVGLSKDMINLLHEMRNIPPADKSLLLSEKEINRLHDFYLLFNRIWDNAKRTMQKIGATLIPVAQQILIMFNSLTRTFMMMTTSIIKMVQEFPALNTALKITGAIMVAVFSPLIASLSALMLILDDIAAWNRGDKSFLGWLIGRKDSQSSGEKANWDKYINSAEKAEQMSPTIPKSFHGREGASVNQNNTFNIAINDAKDPVKTALQIKKIQDRVTSDLMYQLGPSELNGVIG